MAKHTASLHTADACMASLPKCVLNTPYDIADEKQLNFTRLQALKWMRQTAAALKYLHNMKPKPILHRDLKPDNILLTRNYSRVKLADFGISTEWRTHMTNDRGTASYIAPEVRKRTETYCDDTLTSGRLFTE
ncbi:unnamed protein product [Sphagnum balticum]